MYRKKFFYGCVVAAFGAGVLLGLLVPSGFLKTIIGLGLTALGVFLLLK